jgi:hypothetical protein
MAFLHVKRLYPGLPSCCPAGALLAKAAPAFAKAAIVFRRWSKTTSCNHRASNCRTRVHMSRSNRIGMLQQWWRHSCGSLAGFCDSISCYYLLVVHGPVPASLPGFTDRSLEQTDQPKIDYTFFTLKFSMAVGPCRCVVAGAVDAPVNAARTTIGGQGFAQMFPGSVKTHRQIISC